MQVLPENEMKYLDTIGKKIFSGIPNFFLGPFLVPLAIQHPTGTSQIYGKASSW